MATQIPPGAPRSEDNFYWWDQEGNNGNGQWQLVNEPEPAGPQGGAQHGGARQAGAAPAGGRQGGAQPSDQQARQPIWLDLNQFPALWRLSQIYPNEDGVTQYLGQLGVDVYAVDWDLHQGERDAFYNAVPAASNAIYQVVAQIMGDANEVTAPVVTAAAEAMNQVVATGGPIRDFLYSDGYGAWSDNLRDELEELRSEVGWLTQAVTG